jgi:hypothetical protein
LIYGKRIAQPFDQLQRFGKRDGGDRSIVCPVEASGSLQTCKRRPLASMMELHSLTVSRWVCSQYRQAFRGVSLLNLARSSLAMMLHIAPW